MFSVFEKLFQISAEPDKPEVSLSSTEAAHTSPEEAILGSGEKKSSKDLGGGSNDPVFVEIKDDGSGIFKAKTKEFGLRDNVKAGTYYKRERAAYLVSRFLGFDLVPPTVIRDIDGEIGSMQRFIDNAQTDYEINWTDELNKLYKPEIIKLWLFDYLVFSSDRHKGNILFKDGKVFAIDNGLTFGQDYLRMYSGDLNTDGLPIPESVTESLKKSFAFGQGNSILRELLAELLPEKEVEAFFERLNKVKMIIESGKLPSLYKLVFK